MLATLNKNSGMIISLLLAGAFAMIALELNGIGHNAGPRQIAFITPIVGAILSLISAFLNNKMVRTIIGVLMIVVAAIGVYGFTVHQGGQARRDGVLAQLGPQQGPLGQLARTYDNMPPTFSPLSLAGLGLMGAVASLAGAGQAAARKAE